MKDIKDGRIFFKYCPLSDQSKLGKDPEILSYLDKTHQEIDSLKDVLFLVFKILDLSEDLVGIEKDEYIDLPTLAYLKNQKALEILKSYIPRIHE